MRTLNSFTSAPACVRFCIAAAFCLATTLVTLAGGTWDANTSGNWNEDAKWSGNVQPTLADLIILRDGTQSVTVTDAGEVGFRVILGQSDVTDHATLNIDSGDLTLATSGSNAGLITMGTAGGDAFVNLSGGTLNASNLDFRALATNENQLNISGGIFNMLGTADFVADGTGLVSVTGSSGDINVGANTRFGATTTLDYTLDGSGVSSWDTGGVFTINAGANLEVDASLFTPGATTITLATYGSLANANEFVESVTAPTGYTADIVYGANSLDLVLTAASVPEPSSMLLVAVGLGFLTSRRRRARPLIDPIS